MTTATMLPLCRMSVERWSPAFADCPLRVLVVDNCKDTADSLTSLVKLWGYDVEVAYDGETAITTALVYRPDVIFLDLAMPSMSGCEIVKRLRGEEGVKDAVMVAVTGYADQTHRQQAMEAGFDLYLVKPVDPVVLRDVLVRSEKKEGGSDHAIREV